jgi:hypothetical protein
VELIVISGSRSETERGTAQHNRLAELSRRYNGKGAVRASITAPRCDQMNGEQKTIECVGVNLPGQAFNRQADTAVQRPTAQMELSLPL